jgi:phosphatidylethanolamine-binding protein (PEBP) family uncharacterized protein
MRIAEAAYVTTIDPDGFPQTRAMFNLRRKEQFPGLASLFKDHQYDFLVYFTTNTSSLKPISKRTRRSRSITARQASSGD